MKNRLFKSDERISAVYNRIGTIGFHILSVLVWLNLIYRMVILNQRLGEVLDIVVVFVFIGIFYIIIILYFIKEAVINTNKEKPSGLSIAALFTGILPYIFTPVIPFILGGGVAFSLTTAAIVCGSIDLRRIKTGLNSIKGKGLDIAGIILGSIGVLYTLIVFIFQLIL